MVKTLNSFSDLTHIEVNLLLEAIQYWIASDTLTHISYITQLKEKGLSETDYKIAKAEIDKGFKDIKKLKQNDARRIVKTLYKLEDSMVSNDIKKLTS